MTEHEALVAWLDKNGLSLTELSERTGYAYQTVWWFTQGKTPPKRNADEKDRRIKDWVWLRFKRACGDVDATLNGRNKGDEFAW